MSFTSLSVWPLNIEEGSVAGFALNGALSGSYSANWFAFGIIIETGGTVSKIRAYVTQTVGTVGANDFACALFSDSNGSPNTQIEEVTYGSGFSGAQTIEFTGFTATLTARTLYWVMLRNKNATPTSNYMSISRIANYNGGMSVLGHQTNANSPAFAGSVNTSTNSGSSWSRGNSVPGIVIEYSGGAKEGFPWKVLSSSGISATEVYGSREVGSRWTSPSGANLQIKAALWLTSKAGSPSTGVRCRIYTGSGASPTLLATSETIPAASIHTTRGPIIYPFSSTVTIPPSTLFSVVLSRPSNADTSSNRYNVVNMTATAGETTLAFPWSSTGSETCLSTDGGATFSFTSDAWNPVALILADTPITSSGGGGGLLVHPGMAGGLRG